MLDSRRLEIYCAVAEEGSFTAAAARLNLTQSAVSQQIAILERDVGLALMERVPRGVKLTPAGQFLAKRAQGLLREMSGLEQELHRLADPPKAVTLGVFATAGAHLVPMLVSRYRQRYPETQLVLHASQPEDLPAKLLAGEIDVGITWDYDFLMRPVGDLHRQHLLADPMVLLLPADHPLADEQGSLRLTELSEEPWIVRTHRSTRYEDAFEVMCRIAGFEPRIVFRTEDYQSVQGMVAAKVGVAVAPRLSMRAQRPDIVVRPIHSPAFARRIDAIALPGYRSNPLAEQLLVLLGELREDAAP
ncbi:LysR family transcriptional regulator [Caulobacter sp. S45]|uniref:LysR family transcriptional regulator n=1 Tax=Caulobacter sp. S45 TaxID=1641861 RepID=UPI00131C8BD7|nr:LysR family transcriptional regulator [Caulobacter sp. S45]